MIDERDAQRQAQDARAARAERPAARTSTGGWKTVTSTTLVASTPVNGVPRSKFSKRLRIKTKGTYRVRVRPGDGDHAAGTSRTRTLRVH